MPSVNEDATADPVLVDIRLRLLADNPFPGLRPFENRDSPLFAGRDAQIEDLRDRLTDNNFLAVIGVSGSGKSSLIRAGLIPVLYQGFLGDAGTHWRIALMRPGKAPIAHLASELDKPAVLGASTTTLDTLRQGSRGLLSVAKRLGPEENLLIVVDQFEEIFRYKDLSNVDEGDTSGQAIAEADAFVGLLVDGLQDDRIVIVITMRSDYLGDCARFPRLANQINRGQYLIPALLPSEQRQIIEFPIHAKGAKVSEPLISRLISDLGSDPARLPVVQHVLRRTWEAWAAKASPDTPIDLCDYKKVGGCSDAMDIHATEAFNALQSKEHKWITKVLFQRITVGGEDRKTPSRRPTELKDIVAVVDGVRYPERRKVLHEVIQHYRSDSVAFLSGNDSEHLRDDSIIDITHESLCQLWTDLSKWVKEEVQSAWWYRRTTESALLENKIKAGLKKAPLPDVELSTILDAYLPDSGVGPTSWTPAWSIRYNAHYKEVVEFIEYSRQERLKREEERKAQEELAAELRAKEMARRRGRRFLVVSITACAGLIVAYLLLLSGSAHRAYRSSTPIAAANLLRIAAGSDMGFKGSMAGNHGVVLLLDRKRAALAAHSLVPDGPLSPSISLWLNVSPHIPAVTSLLPSILPSESSKVQEQSQGVPRLAVSQKSAIAVARSDGSLTLFDLNSKTGFQNGVNLNSPSSSTRGVASTSGSIKALVYSGDGNYLASGGENNELLVYQLSLENHATVIKVGESVYAAIFSPNNRYIAVAGQSSIRIFSLEGSQLTSLPLLKLGRDRYRGQQSTASPIPSVLWMGFDKSGTSLLAALQDQTIHLYRLEYLPAPHIREVGEGRFLNQGLASVALANDGSGGVVGQQDGTITFFDATKFELSEPINLREPASFIAFDSSSRTLAVGTASGAVLTYDAHGIRKQPSAPDHSLIMRTRVEGRVSDLAFDIGSRYVAVAVAGVGTVSVLDISSGREITHLDYESPISEIAVIASGSGSGIEPAQVIFVAQDSSAGIFDIKMPDPPFESAPLMGRLGCPSAGLSSTLSSTAGSDIWAYACGPELHVMRGQSKTGTLGDYLVYTATSSTTLSNVTFSPSDQLLAWSESGPWAEDFVVVAKLSSDPRAALKTARQSCGTAATGVALSSVGGRVACIAGYQQVQQFQVTTNDEGLLLTRSSVSSNMQDVNYPLSTTAFAYGAQHEWAKADADPSGNSILSTNEASSLQTLIREPVRSLVFNADGTLLAEITSKRTFLYNLSLGDLENRRKPKAKEIPVSAQIVSFNKDGSYVALATASGVQVFRIRDWSGDPISSPVLIATVNESNAIQAVAFDEDNELISTAVGSLDTVSRQRYPIDMNYIAAKVCSSLEAKERRYSEEEWQDVGLATSKWLHVDAPETICPTSAVAH